MTAEAAGGNLGHSAIDLCAGGNHDVSVLQDIGGHAAAEGLALLWKMNLILHPACECESWCLRQAFREEAGRGARCRCRGRWHAARTVTVGAPARCRRCPRQFRRRRFEESGESLGGRVDLRSGLHLRRLGCRSLQLGWPAGGLGMGACCSLVMMVSSGGGLEVPW